MALQKFYLDHQEYDFVYNWEMDVRYIGNYLDYFEGVEGAQQLLRCFSPRRSETLTRRSAVLQSTRATSRSTSAWTSTTAGSCAT
jgi:hypothetical protein